MNNCLECGKFTKNPKFCSRSCSAKYNNRKYPKRLAKKRYCKNCGKELKGSKRGNKLFCNLECHNLHKEKVYIKKWISGEESGTTGNKKPGISGYVKHYLLKKSGYKCQKCGWNEINPTLGYPVLEIHHMDGNRENNRPKNLIVLCPNCHSITENYRALNLKN